MTFNILHQVSSRTDKPSHCGSATNRVSQVKDHNIWHAAMSGGLGDLEDDDYPFSFGEDDEDDILLGASLLQESQVNDLVQPPLVSVSTSETAHASNRDPVSPISRCTGHGDEQRDMLIGDQESTQQSSPEVIYQKVKRKGKPRPLEHSAAATDISHLSPEVTVARHDRQQDGVEEPEVECLRVKKKRRKIPGPAGKLHDPDWEVDPDLALAKDIMRGPAWRAMLFENGWRDGDPRSPVTLFNISWINKRTTNAPFKKVPLAIGILVSFTAKKINGTFILADKTDKILGDLSQEVITNHLEELIPGTIMVLQDVTVQVSTADNYMMVGIGNVVSMYSPLGKGYRASFLSELTVPEAVQSTNSEGKKCRPQLGSSAPQFRPYDPEESRVENVKVVKRKTPTPQFASSAPQEIDSGRKFVRSNDSHAKIHPSKAAKPKTVREKERNPCPVQ